MKKRLYKEDRFGHVSYLAVPVSPYRRWQSSSRYLHAKEKKKRNKDETLKCWIHHHQSLELRQWHNNRRPMILKNELEVGVKDGYLYEKPKQNILSFLTFFLWL